MLVPSLALLYTLVLRGRLDTVVMAVGPDASQISSATRASRGSESSPASWASRGRLAAPFAIGTLAAGVGLLVFADPAWTHGVGALCLLACAVTVFALVVGPPEQS